MEIRKGYKQTEIGLIPEDWDVKELIEIGYFSKGKGINKSEANTGELPAIRYGEIYTKHHNVLMRFYSFISEEVARNSKELKEGDLLFAGSGETKEDIGKTVAYISNVKAYVGGDIVILSPNKSCNSLFLGYLLNHSAVQKQKAASGQGDAVVHIYASNLKNIKIPLPPLSEQIAIAAALSDADAYIESLEQLLEKKRQVKQGAMQELLRPKEGWEVKKLGEICDNISSGKSNTQSQDGSFPIFGSTGIIGWSKTNDYSGSKILVARVGANAGAVNKVDGRYCVSDNTLMVSLKPEIDLNFVFSFLILFQLNKLVFGSGQPLITGGQLKNIEISIPKSKEEQTRIATILSDMDMELEAIAGELEKARQLKQGMMQELLTGRVRLV